MEPDLKNDESIISPHSANRIGISVQDEIFSNPPAFFLRSGISIVLIVTVVLLVFAWLVRYPDVIQASLELSGDAAPIEVNSKQSGIISKLWVSNGTMVELNDTLLYLDNIANLDDAFRWRNMLAKIHSAEDPLDIVKFDLKKDLILGDMQVDYRQFCEAVRLLKETYHDNVSSLRISQLSAQDTALHALHEVTQSRIRMYEKELSLFEQNYDRTSQLFNDGLISESDYEITEANQIRVRRQLVTMQSELISLKAQSVELRSEIAKIEYNRTQSLRSMVHSIFELSNLFISNYNRWADTHIILAPIRGRVSVPSKIRAQVSISASDILLSIIPLDQVHRRYAIVNLTADNMGKLFVGTNCSIRLHAWPYKQFGSVDSQIIEISRVPFASSDGTLMYEVKLALPNPLVTNYGREIEYFPKSTGDARIITENRRLIERIFSSAISLLRN